MDKCWMKCVLKEHGNSLAIIWGRILFCADSSEQDEANVKKFLEEGKGV